MDWNLTENQMRLEEIKSNMANDIKNEHIVGNMDYTTYVKIVDYIDKYIEDAFSIGINEGQDI